MYKLAFKPQIISAQNFQLKSPYSWGALKYMGWFFSFGTNASVLSRNNVGRCHFYRRLLTCIPSLRAHDLTRPCHSRERGIAYSPDISPCNYDLIPKMPMRGKRFRTIEDVKQADERSFRTINRLGSANGIQRLPRRWEYVVHNGGDNIEGL